ncbi:MAG TPA: hypothetical protein VII08_09770 [Myxococcales bacterium]|jgi:hypothetical protein
MPESDTISRAATALHEAPANPVLAVLASPVEVSTLRSMDVGLSGEGLNALGAG